MVAFCLQRKEFYWYDERRLFLKRTSFCYVLNVYFVRDDYEYDV